MTKDRKRRPADELARDRADPTHADSGIATGSSRNVVQVLQQQAGNAAVASLIGGGAPAGVQRAPKLGAGDELMSPDGNLVAPRPTNKPAGGGGSTGGNASTAAGAGQAFEAELFDQSILAPMRSLYATVRDSPPDYELALQHLERIGQALYDYEVRYQDRDPGLAEGFNGALGWLSRVRDVLLRRTGEGKEMTDDGISTNVQAVLDGLREIQGRLH